LPKIRPITTDDEHAKALGRIDALMNCANGPEAVELSELAKAVEAYEERRFPLMVSAPIATAPAATDARQPPPMGRWCPYCHDGVMVQYVDQRAELCLDCGRAILITPTAREARPAERNSGSGLDRR
jgi:hypothetical protein